MTVLPLHVESASFIGSPMGYDATNTLGRGVRKSEVREFLQLIGYEYAGRDRTFPDRVYEVFRHYEERDYRSWGPVWASIYERDGELCVATRTNIWVGPYDLAFHNMTMRELRKRFGGFFESDYGKGRYFPVDPFLSPPESGCQLAHRRAEEHLSRLRHYLMETATIGGEQFDNLARIDKSLLVNDPRIFGNNITIPYIVSVLEDYLRYTFVALLKYSPRRLNIIRRARLSAELIEAIASGQESVESAIANALPFQRISAAARHFHELDEGLDLAAELRRPYRRRKRSLYDELEALVELRHGIIHRMETDISLNAEQIDNVVEMVAVSIDRTYAHIAKTYGWSDVGLLPVARGRRRRRS